MILIQHRKNQVAFQDWTLLGSFQLENEKHKHKSKHKMTQLNKKY